MIGSVRSHRESPATKRAAFLALFTVCVLLSTTPAWATSPLAVADVVVVVDTSISMKQPGMDPERTSLLVTKLLADIVPGQLTVVRLLDLAADNAWIPSRDTGKTVPCLEDPSQSCHLTEPIGDWEKIARENTYGASVRPARGDAAFKKALESHLEQRSNNSLFALAFRATQGVFDKHPKPGAPQTVVWLSDGRSDHPENVRSAVAELRSNHIDVTAVVFGNGDTALAQQMGLSVQRTSSPAELMKAFAGIFRRIVQAPYEWDRVLSQEPAFEMKANVDEAWVVVYGDASLSDSSIIGPDGQRLAATHGQDVWPAAGAYRVAYIQRPLAGRWTVTSTGGGSSTAYAVVQRSSLGPRLIEPETAIVGVETRIVAGITSGDSPPLPGQSLPAGVAMEIAIDGAAPVRLVDDGTQGDTVAGDGLFGGKAVFSKSGSVPVRVRAFGDIIDRTADALVEVKGYFRHAGGPLHIDFGDLRAGGRSCRPLALSGEHQGRIPFVLEALRSLPSDHDIEIIAADRRLVPGGDPTAFGPDDALTICLVPSARAPSSSAADEPWLRLRVSGSSQPNQEVVAHLRWRVHGLTFWQRWGWLILLVLGLLALLAIIAGYIVPKRFAKTLAVAFAPEREDLEEQAPQPVAQWKGVGIGFYRDARAYLHANYRLSGNARGALASLHADASGTKVAPGRGQSIHRETLDGDWEPVPAAGRMARGGDVFRVGERGPYFRVTSARR